MSWLDWMIVIIPFSFVLGLAFYAGKYAKSVANYLAAGRVAGRYVLTIGELSAGTSVITMVAIIEAKYQVGYALSFWDAIAGFVFILMSLTGYCLYRFRETRALSFGQFLEMRYSKRFRVLASTIRTATEMIANAIGPAIAAHFFISFLGLPRTFELFGHTIPTYAATVIISLSLAMLVIWPGGRISLLITDTFQGLLIYPISLIFVMFVISKFSWSQEIMPVMLDRVPGESFISPFDVDQLRDFNIFAMIVGLVAAVMNRGSWIGNDASNAGITPHEQKMAGVLGAWRSGFSWTLFMILAIALITLMSHAKFLTQSSEVRLDLVRSVTEETIPDAARREAIEKDIIKLNATVKPHVIGVDKPNSRKINPDTPYLNVIRKHCPDNGTGNQEFQKSKTLYNQLMLPVVMRRILPVGLMGLFCLLMLMFLVSTDDSRIFNAAGTLMQDVILPFIKQPLSQKAHVMCLRLVSLGVALFFLICSLLFSQMDFIALFLSIIGSIWLGGAGPIMIFGLYSRFGNTWGAYASLLFGSFISLSGLFLQRNWADLVYPLLLEKGWTGTLDNILQAVSSPFNPWIVWKMDAVKFPINSYEIYFMAMMTSLAAYVVVSLLTSKGKFNLDKMLHRGEYSVASEGPKAAKEAWTFRTFLTKVIGITSEYTRGDKIIAWSIFFYSVIWGLVLNFFGVLIWNLVSPWPKEWWGHYFFFNHIILGFTIGIISTVWFMIGGAIDIRRLFRNLAARKDNPEDNGQNAGETGEHAK